MLRWRERVFVLRVGFPECRGGVPRAGEEGDNRGERRLVRRCGFRCGWRVEVGGGLPASFEGGKESVFDFGGDVAVGLD